ncbi:hypothetical protein [Lacihabitans soyangensis]|uniref:Uncharacterized protein n=1 Tax=Lacihabitans soyangensis TaxID=869394 RepID=A0AAE3KSU6_9BACT|nr:hypothetical protein [Lacihabitans soyangensis]MCP9761601.1 hypothetical protein [Lacihabitans soyangensis]
MKTYFKIRKSILVGFFILFMNFTSYAGAVLNSGGANSRIASNSTLSQSKRLQTFDVSSLNLKQTTEQKSVQQTNSAISISLADFNAISAVGNTWLLYETNSKSFSMNIGTANSSTPQTWTLPANLYTYFVGAGRSDFIAPSSVPAGLGIVGANKVMVTKYFDFNDRLMDVYDHYFIDGDGIDQLGTSYDLEFGEDDTFDEPNYEYSDVPLDLGDVFVSTIEEEDYETNLSLTRYVQTITADAFGTISTPDGVLNCLRLSIVNQRYTRTTESNPFTLQSTTNQITFMTREGVYFTGTVSATSGTVTVSKFQYREIIPTALLSEGNDVKLNNDSKGVTINTDNDTADPSAILDVKSENMGVLIPRIAKANRPASPAEGLLIYQVDETPGFYYFDGSGWRIMGSSPSARISAESTTPTTTSIIKQSGFANLKKGVAFIKFNRKVDNPEDLIINLQMEGEGKGLFVSKKTPEGFEVKEMNKGKSNARFSYVFDIK